MSGAEKERDWVRDEDVDTSSDRVACWLLRNSLGYSSTKKSSRPSVMRHVTRRLSLNDLEALHIRLGLRYTLSTPDAVDYTVDAVNILLLRYTFDS